MELRERRTWERNHATASPTPDPRAASGPAASTMTLEPPPRPQAPAAKTGPAFHPHAVWAVFARNYHAYFSNPAGYVFIVLFVVVSAIVAFWRPVFFANNLASLGTLNEWMPYILMIFIPAITMNAWAEERRLGTDELLLTLPARDAEVALGKFLAALGIYTTALLFSLSLVAILFWLGSPDLGVIVSTYVGYWLMGMMLIAIGLVASVLSSNVTVAFILGVVFSAVPVFAGLFGLPFHQNEYRRAIEDLSVPSQFRDFGTGVVPLVGLVYFVGLAAAMLYLNMVLLGRRHWAGGERSQGLWIHMLTRVVCVVVALAAAEVLVTRYANARPDLSSEGLHRLSPESLKLIGDIPADKPVYVEAYYSEDVPRELVQTKMDLLNKLREFAAASKGRILLNLVPTELYSEEARQAEKQYGIVPKQVRNADEAKMGTAEVFLGVAFTSGPEEVVVPFFDPGLPVEYELARSIRVVARAQRKKVGVLQTDAKLLGGFDFRSMGQNQEWPIVSELKKQYEVSSVVGRRADPGRPRRPARGPAVEPDAAADRQPHLARQGGQGDAALRRPVPGRRPAALAGLAQTAARRDVRRPADRAQGEPRPAARPARRRLAADGDRLEPVQPAPAVRRDRARDRLHRQGRRGLAGVQSRPAGDVGPAGPRHAVSGPDPLEVGRRRLRPAPPDRRRRRHAELERPGRAGPVRDLELQPAAPAQALGHRLHAGGQDQGQAARPRPSRPTPRRRTRSPPRPRRSTRSSSPTST